MSQLNKHNLTKFCKNETRSNLHYFIIGIVCSLKFSVKVGVKASIMNEPLVSLTSLFGFVINNPFSSNELSTISGQNGHRLHSDRSKTQITPKVRLEWLDLNS
jgi:hypothetical protein